MDYPPVIRKSRHRHAFRSLWTAPRAKRVYEQLDVKMGLKGPYCSLVIALEAQLE